ncbi:MAG TPA: hypothetical protein VKY31_06090, partial [Terriglobia bacterium]|nr:hypothetical protein [Terriglobia bacterium]
PGGVLGKLYGVLKPRPSISTDTAAASNAKSEENNESNNEDTGPVRGGTGTSGAKSGAAGSGSDNSNFGIDPTKATITQPPVKK